MSVRSIIFGGASAAILFGGMFLWAADAGAAVLPFPKEKFRTGEKGLVAVQPRWEYGSTIKVVVQKDTKTDSMGNPLNRHKALEAGIMRWQARLDKLGTGIMIMIIENDDGKPPAGTKNAVPVTFEDDGTSVGEGALKGTLGTDGTGAAVPNVGKDSPFFNGGKIIVQKGYGMDGDKNEAWKNIGEHEFGHILGLGHDDLATVMKHQQGNDPRDNQQGDQTQGMGQRDLQEFDALYKKKVTVTGTVQKKQSQGAGGAPAGSFSQSAVNEVEFQLLSHSADLTSFTYQVDFHVTPGFDPISLHVPFLGIGIDPQLVTSVDLPPGWLQLPWDVAPDPSLPFYALDEYLLYEGLPLDLQVLGDGSFTDYVGMRASPQQAFLSGFPGDPALSVFNPSVQFTVHTRSGLFLGEVSAFGVDGESQLVGGPVANLTDLPEPPANGVFSLTLVAAAFAAQKMWRRTAIPGARGPG